MAAKEPTWNAKTGLRMLWGRPIVPPFDGHEPTCSILSISSKCGWSVSLPALATKTIEGDSQVICPTAAPSMRGIGPETRELVGKDAVLACVRCYPRKPGAHYQMALPKAAGQWRLAFAQWAAINRGEAEVMYVDYMAAAIKWASKQKQNQPGVVRIHDSGDFYSAAYARLLRLAFEQVPDVAIWVSTRLMHDRPQAPLPMRREIAEIRKELELMSELQHVAIRQSAMGVIDGTTKALVPGFHWPSTQVPRGFSGGTIIVDTKTATVPAGAWPCPANSQGHKCDGREHGGVLCRMCNTKNNAIIAYELI